MEMSVESQVRNPFMLMLNPEVVIAAMESSERLKQLHRHECRPLDTRAAAAPEDKGSAHNVLTDD
jgi:hypothetical protein